MDPGFSLKHTQSRTPAAPNRDVPAGKYLLASRVSNPCARIGSPSL